MTSRKILLGITFVFTFSLAIFARVDDLAADRIHLLDVGVVTLTRDSVVISFTTAADGPRGLEPAFPASARVSVCRVKKDGGCGPRRTVVESTSTPYHLVKVSGLEEGVRYRYHVEVSGRLTGSRRAYRLASTTELSGAVAVDGGFTTLRKPPGRYLFSFATLSDLQITTRDDHYYYDRVAVGGGRAFPVTSSRGTLAPATRVTRLVGRDSVGQMFREAEAMAGAAVKDINRHREVAFTVVLGDLVQGGRLSEFAAANRVLDALRRPYFVTPGNHDALITSDGDGRRGWNAYFPKTSDRVIDLPGARIVILDTAYPRVTGGIEHEGLLKRAQIDWLRSKLSPEDPPTFVLSHHGPYRTYLEDGKPAFGVIRGLLRKEGNVVAVLYGHGHRNKVHGRLWPGGPVSAESMTTMQYPSGYNIYDVYEGGFVQSFYKTESDAAVRWSEMSRRIHRLGPHAAKLSREGRVKDRNFTFVYGRRTSIERNGR